MTTLSNYNPIRSIVVPGDELLKVEGIVVIVGPNSSGKTLFLQDIEKFLCKGEVNFIVCNSIVPQIPDDIGVLFQDLVALNFIRPTGNPTASNPNESYQLNLPEMGVNSRLTIKQPTPRPQFSLATLRNACQNLNGNKDSLKTYFLNLGEAFVATLSLEERRKVCDTAPNFPHDKQPPRYRSKDYQLTTGLWICLNKRLSTSLPTPFGWIIQPQTN